MNITLEHNKIYCGQLLLVNAGSALKSSNNEELRAIDPRFPDIKLQAPAAYALRLILSDIKAGNAIVPVSGYRSEVEQAAIYQKSMTEHGEEFTSRFVALPGRSEHQTGLAADLGLNQDNIDFIRPYFPYKGICGAFRDAAPDFGFVERYPKGKEAVSGIAHEPWHFRYVGYPHSKIMSERRLILEEYIDFIKAYQESNKLYEKGKNSLFEIYYVPAAAEKTTISIPDRCDYRISGNNLDGFIVTVRRNRL